MRKVSIGDPASPISPLLMNAYLHTYARRLLHLKNTELRYVRYAHGPYRSKEPEKLSWRRT
uniref:Uncharacterized protein n=1 Tax=Picea glauca TaxID=3330 RepID=A0A117NIW1_PICGL|nr:hypothetical protein ABT39_MTgene457 [Picea glauca]QHR88183.1 hypothetical protein Q903MT_gene2196 [Picea sitchensis]